MKYMGSKSRHWKDILPIILKDRSPGQYYVEPVCHTATKVQHNTIQYYVEPFVGGFNVIIHVDGPRIANDKQGYLIALFIALRDGWIPPDTFGEDEYIHLRDNKEAYDPALVGFVGFGLCYGAKWFGGYARGKDSKGNPRNYCLENKTNLLKQVPGLQGITIHNKNYYDFYIPPKSLIYCDPPYQGTTKYAGEQFDYNQFWDWCRIMQVSGHSIFVSEYSAPDDFTCVWEKQVNNTLVKDTGSKQGIERLFIPNA